TQTADHPCESQRRSRIRTRWCPFAIFPRGWCDTRPASGARRTVDARAIARPTIGQGEYHGASLGIWRKTRGRSIALARIESKRRVVLTKFAVALGRLS